MEILLIHKGRKKVLYRLIHARKNASNSTKKSFNAYAALAMESSSSMDCGGEISSDADTGNGSSRHLTDEEDEIEDTSQ